MNNTTSTIPISDKSTPNETVIVGIGASAGGIEALTEFFNQVQPDSGMAYVVILHLSPDYDSQLTQILQNVTSIPVTQVTERAEVVANHIYVVPPNKHLQMQDGTIIVVPNTHIEERRAPVDIFLRTLAETHRSRAIGVILSGTGANGSMGLKRIKENGGGVFVQSPREAVFSEMPRHAIATDLVDAVLPVAQIPARLQTYRQRLGTIDIPVEAPERSEDQQQALREVFTQLRLRTGHDFSNYKRPTLLRRLARRIYVRNLPDLPAYVAFLRENPEEVQALLKDLLISVTNFFRDPKIFTALEQEVIPALISSKKSGDTLRVWVAGCATGEEAYSLAMLLAERTMGILDAPDVQIFATDIDEEAIATAREGLYTLNDAADVSPERLRRFFTKEGDEYRIRREIREMILFAHHNVLKDPPFSRLDLASCRNLLIYLNQVAQDRIMETFHFALNPGGYLLLGQSETIDGSNDLYTTLSREHHLYQSRQVAARPYPIPESVPTFLSGRKRSPEAAPDAESRPPLRPSYGDLHQQLLEQYAPPSIIVNEEYDILHLSGRAGRYLHIAGGEPTKNLLKLIRPELRLELRTAFIQATQLQTNVDVRNLTIRIDDQPETIIIHVRPVLRESDPARGFILVLFEPISNETNSPTGVITSIEPVAHHLEEELMRVKAQLRSSNEHHELQAEELKASNEELQAMNEELRSVAEELETGKEELQSINEELITVNQELKIKVEEISISSNNFQNLINSTDIATLFLDRSLRVNLFTPATRELFNLIPSDFGRPLTDITNRLDNQNLSADAERVLETLQPIEREVQSTNGATFIMRVLPYRTADDRINGVVVTFVDITERKAVAEALRESEEQFRLFVTASSDVIYKMSADWRQMLYLKGRDFLADTNDPSASWLEQYIPPEDWSEVEKVIQKAIQNRQVFELEHQVVQANGAIGWTFSRAVPVLDGQGHIRGWFGTASDITLRKQAEAALRASEIRQVFLLQLSDALRPLSDAIDIQATAARFAMDHFGADRCYYCQIEDGMAIIQRDASQPGLPSVAGTYPLSSFPLLEVVVNAGRPFVVSDVHTTELLDESLKDLCIQLQVISFVNIPVIKNDRPVGVLCITQRIAKDWVTVDVDLAQEIAERTWTAVERARIEADLRESEQRLASIRPLTLLGQTEDLANIGSWEYNQQTGQFSWSNGMYKLFEIELGQPVQPQIYHDFAIEEDKAKARRLVNYLRSGRGHFEIDLRIRVGEQIKTLRIKADVIGAGDQQRVLGVDLDISDQLAAQRQIQETAENLQAVLDGSPAAIGLLKTIRDPAAAERIIDFQLAVGNRKLAHFFNKPLKKLLGKSARQFGQLLWGEATPDILRQIRLTGEAHYDEKQHPTDGRWLAIAVTQQDDGVMVTVLDITDLKTTQAEQQQWFNEVEVSRQSVDALSELRQSLRYRSELLRAVSHDLRGNFGIINGALHLLSLAVSEAERAQMMEMALRNVRQATGMLTELLDYSRLEAGQEKRTIITFDVTPLLQELSQSLQPAADEQKLRLESVGPETLVVEGDRLHVHRMAQNLIINAIKYTHTGSITVNWGSDDKQARWWFSVSDTGPGIDADLVVRLNMNGESKNGSTESTAQPQSASLNGEEPGAAWTQLRSEGIGLRIVRQLADLLDARLQVSSETGVGTRFVVSFPMRYKAI